MASVPREEAPMRRLLRPFPKRLSLVSVALLGLWLALPALAQDDDEPAESAQEEEEAEEEEEPGAFRQYISDRTNVAAAGLNGIVTSIADPVARARQPVETFSGWVTPFRQTFSVLTGVLEGGYRALMGACDVAFSPIPGMPMLSPLQRYKVIGFTHADE
jgi:hypothetical protein